MSDTHDDDPSNIRYRAGYLLGLSINANEEDKKYLKRASQSLLLFANRLEQEWVPHGTYPKVEVRDLGDGYDWRLFVGPYGVATWPSKAANEDPKGYAEEVARVLRKALPSSDSRLDVLEAAARICREHADVCEDPKASQAAEECSAQILEFRNTFKPEG